MRPWLRRLIIAWLVVLAFVALPARLAFGDPPATAPATPAERIAAGRKLLAEADRLADQGDTNAAVLRYKEAMEQLLPVMRGLPFKAGVKGELTPRDKLKDMLVEKLADELTPEEIRAEELTLKAFGLVPADMDLKQTMLKLLTEEIAGFYDPKTKGMHLIKEADPKPGEKAAKPGLLGKLFGGGPKKFDKAENLSVIAHEMTHALADQHYDLDKLSKITEGDGDREMALSALVEGEAMLTMMGAASGDWEGQATAGMPADRLRMMMGLLGPFMTMGSGPSLKEAPPILQESLIFPYIKGLIFCATLTNDGGWKRIDKAYGAPPLSTEQILHPEKYAGKQGELDAPQAVELGKLTVPEGWKEVARNVTGEFGVRVMLKSAKAAEGWDGDTYAVFEGPGKKLAVVWVSTWDDEAEASEFARAYSRYQTRLIAAGPQERGDKDAAPAKGEAFKSLRREHQGGTLLVERRGVDVVVVEGFDTKATDALANSGFEAKKSEKRADQPAKGTQERVIKGGDTNK